MNILKNNCGQQTRGAPPVWVLAGELTTPDHVRQCHRYFTQDGKHV
jgi:hypothetical protein